MTSPNSYAPLPFFGRWIADSRLRPCVGQVVLASTSLTDRGTLCYYGFDDESQDEPYRCWRDAATRQPVERPIEFWCTLPPAPGVDTATLPELSNNPELEALAQRFGINRVHMNGARVGDKPLSDMVCGDWLDFVQLANALAVPR